MKYIVFITTNLKTG
jgi:hypothetical protein